LQPDLKAVSVHSGEAPPVQAKGDSDSDAVATVAPDPEPIATGDAMPIAVETAGPATGVARLDEPAAEVPPEPDQAALPEDKPPQTPGPHRPATSAGFWERLFTGLTPVPSPLLSPEPEVRPTRPKAADAGAPAGERSGEEPSVRPAAPAPAGPTGSSVVVLAEQLARLPLPTSRSAQEDPPDSVIQALAAMPGTAPAWPAAASVAGSLPVPQIAAQITTALSHSADGATELALSPEELGHVRLRLERDAKHPDRVTVMITFERPETLDLFRRHAGELAEALRSAGYAGADIGFGQQGGGSRDPDRNPGAAVPGSDYRAGLPGLADMPTAPESRPRLTAGASLDLRL
jgi:hypothetical protein